MFKLNSLLGTAPSSREEEVRKEETYSIMVDMRKRINAEEAFSFVYVELARQNGKTVGDTKYISELVGGVPLTSRSIGVLVPFGEARKVYAKLEQLVEAPFQSELRIGHSSFPGQSEQERHIIGDILVEAQRYRTRRTYTGKQSNPPASGEKLLECA
jgi:hypothetical protein